MKQWKEWTSCKYALPPLMLEVLFIERGKIQKGFRCGDAHYNYFWRYEPLGRTEHGDVSHWMTLPELPTLSSQWPIGRDIFIPAKSGEEHCQEELYELRSYDSGLQPAQSEAYRKAMDSMAQLEIAMQNYRREAEFDRKIEIQILDDETKKLNQRDPTKWLMWAFWAWSVFMIFQILFFKYFK